MEYQELLPDWADLRPYQAEAIEAVIQAFDKGDTHVFLDAPTGSGKTLIGYMVSRILGVRCLYLCTSISLQEQFIKDFPEAALLKGRANYPTANAPELFATNLHLSCKDCTKEFGRLKSCSYCPSVQSCPYEIAKAAAYKSNLVCTNTAYFLTEANYVGKLVNPDRPTLVVIDEADTLEANLGSFITFTISERAQRKYAIRQPNKKTVASSWQAWVEETIPQVEWSRGKVKAQLAGAKDREKVFLGRDLGFLSRLADSLGVLAGDEGLSTGNWVYTGYGSGDITFKPVRVDALANKYLWSHATQFLLMSATIVSSTVMAESLGI